VKIRPQLMLLHVQVVSAGRRFNWQELKKTMNSTQVPDIKRIKKMKKQLGFTMIELMIVLVVISILAAFAFPSYRDSVRKSNRAQAKTALMRLMQQQEQYFTQNNSYIVFSRVFDGCR
jgi:prepilin-type N-terminal cleavage/methylation domain-containing protein